jgi:glycosyltransferase involved in cell wall biosynthesis
MFVLSWAPTGSGGVNEAVLGLAGALSEANPQLRPLIAVTTWGPISLPSEIRGIPVIGLPLHDAYEAGFWAGVKSASRLPSDLPALARAVRAYKPKIVNLHFPSLGGAAFLMLRRLNLYDGKVALTFHGADLRSIDASKAFTRIAWRHYLTAVDAVFVCSRSLAAELKTLSPHTDAVVVHNGADITAFSRIRHTPARDTKRILCVARFEHKKGHDVLLAAFRRLLAAGLDCSLTLVGTSGPTLDEIREAATTFGDRVRVLVGVPHANIPEYMAECDVFVLPSRAEGFPIVLIEAGAAGLAVVATRIAGVTEFISDEVTGLLAEPEDEVSLANALRRVLDNAPLASSLAARLQVEAARFTWKRAAEEFIAALL